MTPPRSLAEIVEEGERLEADARVAEAERMTKTLEVCEEILVEFFREHGPRLLAVCRAAVEWEEGESQKIVPCGNCRHCNLRAAVRGDEGKGRG